MKVAVVGLGYVGLPLAVALARKHDVVGFDISARRVAALREGVDATNEIASEELEAVDLKLTDDPADLAAATSSSSPCRPRSTKRTVPILLRCSALARLSARRCREGSIVVFESTVYPGVTEEVCAPMLEKASGLKAGRRFQARLQPERINPGDKEHRSRRSPRSSPARTPRPLQRSPTLYGSIIEAGIHQAPSIKVAEAAKVIENTQRDLNIALMNEIAKICHLLDIRTPRRARRGGDQVELPEIPARASSAGTASASTLIT